MCPEISGAMSALPLKCRSKPDAAVYGVNVLAIHGPPTGAGRYVRSKPSNGHSAQPLFQPSSSRIDMMSETALTTSGSRQRDLSPQRQSRYLERARSLITTDPAEALTQLQVLFDHGVEDPQVYALKAEACLALGCGTFAAEAAARALALGGDRVNLLRLQLRAHLAAFNRKAALATLDLLLAEPDLETDDKAEAAQAAHELHRYDLSEALYAELLEANPSDARSLINLGFASHKLGHMPKARDLYQRAIAIRPEATNALRLLADAKKQTADDNDKALISDTLAKLAPGTDAYATAAYSLGKVEEDLKQYTAAFEAFSTGAQIIRKLTAYSDAAARNTFNLTKAYFTGREARRASPVSGATPIFILGMPRSGSTLIDRILSSHTDVVSMGELGCFKEAMKVATNYGGGEGFHDHFYRQKLTPDLNQLGQLYVDAASPSEPGPKYFIDKYPANYMDLGLMAEALPEAKFIHSIRHPLDTIFGNFKQLFTLGYYPYSYDLSEAAHYYVMYRDLMAFWHQRFPGRILDVVYEDVVTSPETEARRMLDYLGLDWQAQVLRFYENAAPVDTASLSQVRRPIYTSAKGNWRHYEAQMSEAIAIVQRAGIAL